jgi:HAD superfamily hydrolase (TIGR01450 family)
MDVSAIRGFLFDLDGCIYSGSQLYPGALELLRLLHETDKKIMFVSNNSTDRAATIRAKLLDMKAPAENSTILVATELVGTYLNERYGTLTVAVVGSADLIAALEESGHLVVPLEGTEPVDAVIVGRDTEFTYQKLEHCGRHLSQGAKLIAANLDLYHPGVHGELVPETGSLVAAIQSIAKTEVEVVGKPTAYPFNRALSLHGLLPSECVMIGDNLFTDIQGGLDVGMHTVWISHAAPLSGETGIAPHKTVKQIAELYLDWSELVTKTL